MLCNESESTVQCSLLIAALYCNGQRTFSCCCTALSSTRSDPQLGVLTLREQEFASFNSPKDKLSWKKSWKCKGFFGGWQSRRTTGRNRTICWCSIAAARVPAWRWKTIPCLHTSSPSSRVVGGKILFLFESDTGLAEISEQHENNRCCSLTKLQEEGEVKAVYMREGSMLGELNKQTNETQVPPTWRMTGKF